MQHLLITNKYSYADINHVFLGCLAALSRLIQLWDYEYFGATQFYAEFMAGLSITIQ